MTKLRYTVYDTTSKKSLLSFHRPVDKLDAAVTKWTRNRECALKFPGTKSARNVALWLNANHHGGCVVLNAKGAIV